MTDIAPQPVRKPTIPGPVVPARTPRLRFPHLACDSHAHVFGPQSRFPYEADAAFIPPDASLADYAGMLRTIGCERAVLVQPSVYGTDNRCMVDALRSGRFDLRGVAVVDPDIDDRELENLHEAGVRGVRINVVSLTPGLRLEHASAIAERIRPLGWHLQFFVDIGATPGFVDQIAALPVPCVIDHFGHVRAGNGIDAAPAQMLLQLASLDHVWFKLMGGYRVSQQLPPYPEVTPIAQALIQRAPDRCVWGTDWPHPMVDRMDDDGDLADTLATWVDDPELRTRVLVDNPARLYDFPMPG